MLPVLFSLGPVTLSSFGLFLSLAFLFGSFLVWRLARAWDLDEEKVLDLILLTFFGGLIGSRLYFAALHFDFFSQDLFRVILFTKYPGLSFWGGILGGWLMLKAFAKRLKLSFWQMADIAAVGFWGGLVFGDLGCFLGGCDLGVESRFGVTMVGVLGKRFPIQLAEATLAALVLLRIWPKATHFHYPGQIIGLSLIFFGVIKFSLEFFRANPQGGHFLSLVLLCLGFLIFYHQGKRSFRADLVGAFKFLADFSHKQAKRDEALLWIKKSLYNNKVLWSWRFHNFKKLLRRIRVKPTPKNFQPY